MKFVEELDGGDCFLLNGKYYIVSNDYSKKKSEDFRSCIKISDGFSNWIKSNEVVEQIPLFTLDIESNIVPIKETKKEE